jgi:hypothetical protein
VFLDPLRWRAHPELARPKCTHRKAFEALCQAVSDTAIYLYRSSFFRVVSNFIQTAAAMERTLRWVPGLSLAMSITDQFGHYAEETIVSAESAKAAGTVALCLSSRVRKQHCESCRVTPSSVPERKGIHHVY